LTKKQRQTEVHPNIRDMSLLTRFIYCNNKGVVERCGSAGFVQPMRPTFAFQPADRLAAAHNAHSSQGEDFHELVHLAASLWISGRSLSQVGTALNVDWIVYRV
jgi:hypothetical protein